MVGPLGSAFFVVGMVAMGVTLMGRKLGMTRVYGEDNVSVPVTIIEIGSNVVTQVRTPERDGYAAVQLGYGDMKARNSTMPQIGHDAAAGSGPKRHHQEFRVSEDEIGGYELGQELTVEALGDAKYVDVIGTSKGKGFQGGMKRHGFKGQQATHGVERKHRSPGSIAGHSSNPGKSGRIKKGKKMSGQMGNARVTVRSLDVVRVDSERGLMLVKGPVPGHNKAMVMIRPSVRLYKSKGV